MKQSLREELPTDGAVADEDLTPRQDPAEPVADAADKGVDARRLAEQKAEQAGRRWRAEAEAKGAVAKEVGGPQGLEPTRYGDWEKAGRCIDF